MRRASGLVAGLVCALVVAAQPAELKLMSGTSTVIDYAGDIERISTSNPEVADAVAVTRKEVLVQAKTPGLATIIIWSKTGERTFYGISVEQNLEPIRKLLKETFPNEQIQLQGAREALSLTGRASNQAVAERAAALVAPWAKAVVNNLEVLPPQAEKQILLRVKFAELNRTVANSFGTSLVSTGAANTVARTTTGQFPAPSPVKPPDALQNRAGDSAFSISDALNVFAFRPDLNLAAFIRALQSRGVLQILAEPNLVTINGKEASFLVGGEFPIPIVQGGANAGAVTIQFREFGIRLTFLPALTEHNTVKMHVKPEVSSIDITNAVNFSGFMIPGLSTRRIETNIELSEGQSFVIGGLLDERVTENLSKIPGLAHLPVLGVLFKSRQENRAKTELIVMVTPEVTRPLNPNEPKPSLFDEMKKPAK